MFVSLAAALLMSLLTPLPDDLALILGPPVQHVKFVSKFALKNYKVTAATALKQLDAELDELEAQFEEGTPVISLVAFLYGPLETCLDALGAAQLSASREVEQAVGDVLGAVQPQEPVTMGQYPDELLYGSGGVLDNHRAKLVASVKKTHASLRKRLAKTVALAESRSGIGLTVHLAPSEVSPAVGIMQVDGSYSHRYGVTIDLVLAASRLSVVGDAVILAAGVSSEDFLPANLFFQRAGTFHFVECSVDSETGRFFTLYKSGGVTGAAEGSWALQAAYAGETWSDGVSFGVR